MTPDPHETITVDEASVVLYTVPTAEELRLIRAKVRQDAIDHPVERARTSWHRYEARKAAEQAQDKRTPHKPRKSP